MVVVVVVVVIVVLLVVVVIIVVVVVFVVVGISIMKSQPAFLFVFAPWTPQFLKTIETFKKLQ